MNTTRRHVGKSLTAVTLALAALGYTALAQAQATIKVGVLHSLSGTMAISETVLNWPLFAEKAKQLISQDKVAVVFGCWTACRA